MRNGKIAKLPVSVLDELNRRMEGDAAGASILAWSDLKMIRVF